VYNTALPVLTSQDSILFSTAKTFIFAARIEAFTWAGLLIGMFLKYNLEMTDTGVWLFGRLHGGAFLFYFFVALHASHRLNWPFWTGIMAILAAIPPLVTWPLEIWLQKRGLLSEEPAGSEEIVND
jgi:integral membrane protein